MQVKLSESLLLAAWAPLVSVSVREPVSATPDWDSYNRAMAASSFCSFVTLAILAVFSYKEQVGNISAEELSK